MKQVNIGGNGADLVVFANDQPFSLICGPCAIEGYDLAMETGEIIRKISDKLGIGIVYKSSFDKANRTSIKGKRGIGIDEGLKILQQLRQEFQLPVLTDIHETSQVEAVAQVVDAIQIPALLCRQTDLLLAAAGSGKPVNVKKGQFLAPGDMHKVAEKLSSVSEDIMLTERGVSFGYNRLISDMRALRIMAESGYPVVFDSTHSVQLPAGAGDSTSGERKYIEPLTRAAIAVGVAGIFLESHPRPAEGFSDGPNMVPMGQLEALLMNFKIIDDLIKCTGYISAIV
jgi:2-dehydro-3-deoxyphosphooctonate aldolase (KDO 8-P synthase)